MAKKFMILILAILGVSTLFAAVYGYCNARAATLPKEALYHLYMDWELRAPFISWMIIPYFSLNIFTALPLIVQKTEGILRIAKAYVFSIFIAGLCFYFMPTTAGFQRQEHEGVLGEAFKFLYRWDPPNNLVPSLHITFGFMSYLFLVEGLRLSSRDRNRPFNPWINRAGLGWVALLCVSVFVTHQHHVLDVIAGLLLGWLSFVTFRTPSISYK